MESIDDDSTYLLSHSDAPGFRYRFHHATTRIRPQDRSSSAHSDKEFDKNSHNKENYQGFQHVQEKQIDQGSAPKEHGQAVDVQPSFHYPPTSPSRQQAATNAEQSLKRKKPVLSTARQGHQRDQIRTDHDAEKFEQGPNTKLKNVFNLAVESSPPIAQNQQNLHATSSVSKDNTGDVQPLFEVSADKSGSDAMADQLLTQDKTASGETSSSEYYSSSPSSPAEPATTGAVEPTGTSAAEPITTSAEEPTTSTSLQPDTATLLVPGRSTTDLVAHFLNNNLPIPARQEYLINTTNFLTPIVADLVNAAEDSPQIMERLIGTINTIIQVSSEMFLFSVESDSPFQLSKGLDLLDTFVLNLCGKGIEVVPEGVGENFVLNRYCIEHIEWLITIFKSLKTHRELYDTMLETEAMLIESVNEVHLEKGEHPEVYIGDQVPIHLFHHSISWVQDYLNHAERQRAAGLVWFDPSVPRMQ